MIREYNSHRTCAVTIPVSLAYKCKLGIKKVSREIVNLFCVNGVVEQSWRNIFIFFPINRNDLILLIIPVSPSVVQHPSNATRTVGESVRFECTFSGIPKPTVSWFHVVGDSQKLLTNSPSNILTNGRLEVRQLTKGKEGKYICRATNFAGNANSSAFLKVQGEPSYFVTRHSASFIASERDFPLLALSSERFRKLNGVTLNSKELSKIIEGSSAKTT